MSSAGRGRESFDQWQELAPRWERGRELLWESTRQVSEWLVDRLDPQPGQTILDVAAGTGETGFLAAKRLGDGGKLISSDLSPNMVDAAARVAAELGVANAEFRTFDAQRMGGSRTQPSTESSAGGGTSCAAIRRRSCMRRGGFSVTEDGSPSRCGRSGRETNG